MRYLLIGIVAAFLGLACPTSVFSQAFTTKDSTKQILSTEDLKVYSVFDLKLSLTSSVSLEPDDSLTRHSSSKGSGDEIKYGPKVVLIMNPDDLQVMSVEVTKKEIILVCRIRQNEMDFFLRFTAANDDKQDTEFMIEKGTFNFGIPYHMVGVNVKLEFVGRKLIEK